MDNNKCTANEESNPTVERNSGYSTPNHQNNFKVNQLALTEENLDHLLQQEYVLKSGYEGCSPASIATFCSAQGSPSCSPNRQHQLVLTEDNLDFFLQQEYRLKKNNGNSSSSDGLSSGAQMDVSDFSANEHNRSVLTEENLNFFLQQEYALDTSYDNEKMNLYEFEVAQGTEKLSEDDVKEGSKLEDTDMEELACSSKIEHHKKLEPSARTDEDGELIKKSFKDLFNTDLAPGVYYDVYSSSHSAAPHCTIEVDTSLVVPIPPITAMLPNITKHHPFLFEPPTNEGPPDTEELMETNSDVSKDSTKNDNGNSYSKDIVATSNKIQNIKISQHNKKNDNLEALVSSNAFKEKNSFSNVMSNRTYQSLNISIKSFPSKEPTGLNKIVNDLAAPQEKKIVGRKQDLVSVRDLALASTSSDDIKFIDTDEDCLEPAISHIAYHKTDHDDSKVFKTLFNRSISVENISRVFFDSPSLFFYDKRFEGVVPSKSNLKRKSAQLNSKNNKLKKAGLKFTNVTIFYFERSQGFTSIPSKGGSTLGMENQHFYITTIPIDEYEYKKIKKEPSNMKPYINHIIYHIQNGISEKPKNVQALSITQRVQLLESSDIQIELKEEDDCAHIRSSRAAAGCDCKDYCDPEICSCSLAGIECQVDRPNFPCGCTYENCKNAVGRNEYNHNNVKTHFIKTMRKVKSENKARTSKRKQPLPTKILNNSDIIDNVIQI